MRIHVRVCVCVSKCVCVNVLMWVYPSIAVLSKRISKCDSSHFDDNLLLHVDVDKKCCNMLNL